MGKGDIFGRILTGRKDPKKTEEKSETPVGPPTSNPIERVLNVPLSRRKILGGAATSAAHAAHMATMPQSPVLIQQGIKEAAALLAPRVGRGGFSYLDLVQSFNKPFEYKRRKLESYSAKEEYEGTGEFSPTIESTFAKGAPLTSKGEWAHQQFFEMSWLSRLNLPGALKISDLKNPEIIAEAYRLAGVELPKDRDVAKNVQDSLQVLQRVTGVSDEQTVGDLEKVYGGRIVDIAKKILDNPKFFPPKPLGEMSWDERQQHEIALKYLEDTITHSRLQVDPDLSERIQKERKVYTEFWDERAKQKEVQKASEKTKMAEAQRTVRDQEIENEKAERRKERKEFNDKLKRRESISCGVQNAIKESRDDPNAKVFLITPRRYGSVGDFNGLTRMHIQHLRQLLAVGARGKGLKNPTLTSFDPATTKVEEMGKSIRVSTIDAEFQAYLQSFVGDHRMLEIPNRLQMIVPPEPQEDEEE